jgi:hypothetical protein
MTLQVVEAACSFANDFSSGQVVIESSITDQFAQAIDELGGTEARNLAIHFAARCGCSDPRINGSPGGAYPINKHGQSLDQVRDQASGQPLPPQHPDMQIARYRVDIPICKRLV